MEQNASAKLLRPALRLLLVAGAVALWWLLCSTSAAHADSGEIPTPTGDLTTVSELASLPAEVPGTGDEAAAGAVHDDRSAVSTVVEDITHHTTDQARGTADTVAEDVRNVTRSLPEPLPAVGDATATVLHVTVDRTSTRLTQAVQQTTDAVRPAGSAKSAAAPAEHPRAATDEAPAHSPVEMASQRVLPARPAVERPLPAGSASSSAALVDGAATAPAPTPVDLPAGPAPAAPDAPAAPSSTATASAFGAAHLAVLALLLPLLVERLRVRKGGVLPSGPIFPPDSSPD
jgi:hypothetical protein